MGVLLVPDRLTRPGGPAVKLTIRAVRRPIRSSLPDCFSFLSRERKISCSKLNTSAKNSRNGTALRAPLDCALAKDVRWVRPGRVAQVDDWVPRRSAPSLP